MSLFRTKETKVMIIIFGLFIQQVTNPGVCVMRREGRRQMQSSNVLSLYLIEAQWIEVELH